jgi:hypothetical protein
MEIHVCTKDCPRSLLKGTTPKSPIQSASDKAPKIEHRSMEGSYHASTARWASRAGRGRAARRWLTAVRAGVGRHRRARCGITDGIVRCTSMRRPRRVAWQCNGWRTVKGVICLQRVDERRNVNVALGHTSYTPNPRSAEGFRNPAQPAPEPMPWAGFSLGAEARGGAPKSSPILSSPAAWRPLGCVQ